MPEPTRGILDTSVVIDLGEIVPKLLPDNSAIAAVTLAELLAGPLATGDEKEKARRQDQLQWAVVTWDALPFDVDATRMYGRIIAAMRATGRTSRAHLADLLIASFADANGLPLYMRNPGDFAGLERLVAVKAVSPFLRGEMARARRHRVWNGKVSLSSR